MMPPENNFPYSLRPYHLPEIISLGEAAAIAGRSETTIRNWCNEHGIGRRIGGGKWGVSKPALLMFLDGDSRALHSYLRGDRSSELVAAYFRRCNISLPTSISAQSAKSATLTRTA